MSATGTSSAINFINASVVAGFSLIWAEDAPLTPLQRVFFTSLGLLNLSFTENSSPILLLTNRLHSMCRSFHRDIKISFFTATELAYWSTYYNDFKLSSDFQTFAPQEKSYLQCHNSPFLTLAQEYDNGRIPYYVVKPAATLVIEKIFSQHLCYGPIQELGTNYLDDNGDSYLASITPDRYKPRLSYSDCREEIVLSQQEKTIRRYEIIDVVKLSRLVEDSHINFVAVNVLDTIDRNDFLEVAKGAYHSLRKGGKFIVLSDRPFANAPLFSKYTSDQDVVLSFLSTHGLGIKVIDKYALYESLTHSNTPLQRLAIKVLSLPANQRTAFLVSSYFAGYNLCETLSTLCPANQYTTILNNLDYPTSLTQAFKEQGGFELSFNGYVAESAYSEVTVPNAYVNEYTADLRTSDKVEVGYSCMEMERLYLTPLANTHRIPSIIKLNSVFHVMVFKKIGP